MKLPLRIILGLFVGLCPSLVPADAIIVTKAMTATTIAEVFVEEDTVTIDLEIGLPDLEGFPDLLPDLLYEQLGHDPMPLTERIPRFFREGFVVRADGGPPLPGRVEGIEVRPRIRRDEITGEPLPVSAEDEEEPVVFVRLVYPLERRPQTLTLRPPRSESGFVAANIGLVTYHRGLPVNDFRYLGNEERLELDWDDPWYSRFDNRNLRRQYNAPMQAFLYVDPYEVRKEIVLRPKDLEQWIDLGLAGKEIIPAAEQGALKGKVAEFLADLNPVTINGEPVEGVLDRIHFIRRSLRKTGVIDPPEDLDTISATLGVIFVYPIDGLPDEATLEWELWSDRIEMLPAIATDEAGGLPSFLTPDDPVLRWQNFLTNPTVPGLVEVQAPRAGGGLWFGIIAVLAGIALAAVVVSAGKRIRGGARPTWGTIAIATGLVVVVVLGGSRSLSSSRVADEDAAAIVESLLKNVYRSFDYRDESRIYDILEQSAAGDLLTDIYLETRRSLEIENQGGARAKVNEVEMVESKHSDLGGEVGFVSRSTWNVSGSVGHWGHIHRRRNQYEARVTVKAIDGTWKITDLELLQEKRL